MLLNKKFPRPGKVTHVHIDALASQAPQRRLLRSIPTTDEIEYIRQQAKADLI